MFFSQRRGILAGDTPMYRSWVARGGVGTPVIRAAINRFGRSLQGSGLRSRAGRLSVHCGDSFAGGALVPIIAGYDDTSTIGNTADIASGASPFVGGDWSLVSGLQGKTNAHLATGAGPTAYGMTVGDFHVGFFVAAAGSISNSTCQGAGDSGTTNLLAFSDRTAVTASQILSHSGPTLAATSAAYTAPRRLISCATSATDMRAYLNGVQSGSTQASARSGTLTSREMHVFAYNDVGTARYNTNARSWGYSRGKGMTPSEVAIYDAFVATLLADLGR